MLHLVPFYNDEVYFQGKKYWQDLDGPEWTSSHHDISPQNKAAPAQVKWTNTAEERTNEQLSMAAQNPFKSNIAIRSILVKQQQRSYGEFMQS